MGVQLPVNILICYSQHLCTWHKQSHSKKSQSEEASVNIEEYERTSNIEVNWVNMESARNSP